MSAIEALRRNRPSGPARTLRLVLGDQLHSKPPGELHPDDVVVMFEVTREAEHVPSHRQRTALFLAAMRHHALGLQEQGIPVRYVPLDDPDNRQDLGAELSRAVDDLAPSRITVVRPGDHRVLTELQDAANSRGLPLDLLEDPAFTCTLEEFEAWAKGRRGLLMEHFYRSRRRELGLLMEGNEPRGGTWNLDAENRRAFTRAPDIPLPYRAQADAVTREVLQAVSRMFPAAPGRLDTFPWPVTAAQAGRALDAFVSRKLERFGTYEDAMWQGEPFLYHSLLSPALNLKLLDPMTAVNKAIDAHLGGRVSLNQAEGFVRQIIGWREFIRGVYYREGPEYAGGNTFQHDEPLPPMYWTGETRMACMADSLRSVLDFGYSHHITRLMVLGNFALLAGVNPREIHEWFLGMYVDGVDWVTAPNVIGMSQHADGGVGGSNPYVAGGKYIDRMSNHCRQCPFDVTQRTGEDACPFNTLYWDFLIRHKKRLAANPRMRLSLKNADRLSRSEVQEVRAGGQRVRARSQAGDL